jgi:hypothetical protein
MRVEAHFPTLSLRGAKRRGNPLTVRTFKEIASLRSQ